MAIRILRPGSVFIAGGKYIELQAIASGCGVQVGPIAGAADTLNVQTTFYGYWPGYRWRATSGTSLTAFSRNFVNNADQHPPLTFQAQAAVEITKSSQLDAVIQLDLDGAHQLDAYIQAEFTEVHNLDAVIQSDTDTTHSLDAYIAIPPPDSTKIHDLDAVILADVDRTHQLDAVVLVDLSQTHQLDAFVFIQEFTWSHGIDAEIFFTPIPVPVLQDVGPPNTFWPNEGSPGGGSPVAPLVFAPLSTKDIILPSLKLLFPGSTFVTEENCTGFSINFTPAGGSFSISILRGEALVPGKDFVIQMPMGRVGIVKQTTQSLSSGGLVDVISGPMIPLIASQYTFAATPFTSIFLQDGIYNISTELLSTLARRLTHGIVNWKARDFPIKGFNYRGIALSGVQSLASNILADVIIRDDNILYVAEPDQIVGNNIAISKSEVVSVSQVIDYSAVKKAVINPAIMQVNVIDEGTFIYDDEHAQKQGNTQVSCGAPGGTGAQDFIPIPDGWLVQGSYEEWAPASSEDFTNPAASVPNGRYWKVFPSPSNPGKLRGITSFTRLVKDMKLSGGVSSFVGSPITAQTKTGSSREFILGSQQTESGIAGFTATDTLVLDAISGQAVQVKNALELRPPFGSGNADKNFFSIHVGTWTFPRVAPTIFPGAGIVDPTNPFNIPADTTIVSPPGQIIPSLDYYNYYLAQYKKQNSIKLRTNLSFLFRGTNIPQCGDRLVLEAGIVPEADCGRINTVSVGFNRGGIVVQVSAERPVYGVAERLGYSGVS